MGQWLVGFTTSSPAVTVVLDGQELSALDYEDADELCDLLNLEEQLEKHKGYPSVVPGMGGLCRPFSFDGRNRPKSFECTLPN